MVPCVGWDEGWPNRAGHVSSNSVATTMAGGGGHDSDRMVAGA